MNSTRGRSSVRRTGAGIVAAVLLAAAGLSGCKSASSFGALPGSPAGDRGEPPGRTIPVPAPSPSGSPITPGPSTTPGPPGDGSSPSGTPARGTQPDAPRPGGTATDAPPTTTRPTTPTPTPAPAPAPQRTPSGPTSPPGPPAPTPTAGSPAPPVTGFPAADNTGYPHGLPGDVRPKVTLTAYTGPKTITVAGTVIDGKDIDGPLTIEARNVTIRNSRIRVADAQAVTSTEDDANLLIEDTEVDGQGKDSSAGGIQLIGRTGYTLLRVDAHGSGDILRMDGRATVRDSWLHDPGGTNGAQHNDVIQSTNATYVRILHNRLDNPHTQTSCVLLKADLGPISDVVVDDNLMNGGGYSFYWYDAAYRISNGEVAGNRFMRGYWPKGGYWGTHAVEAATPPRWSGNTWYDTGQQIPV